MKAMHRVHALKDNGKSERKKGERRTAHSETGVPVQWKAIAAKCKLNQIQ